MEVIKGPTPTELPALQTREHIQQLAKYAQYNFLEMGRLLNEAKDKMHWDTLRYESFKEYVEDLGLPMQASYSWATRLMGIYKLIALPQGVSVELLAEIGVAKLSRLLPIAGKGELNEEWLEKAKILSDTDLRIELGHKIAETDTNDGLSCWHCGAWLNGVKFTSRGEIYGEERVRHREWYHPP